MTILVVNPSNRIRSEFAAVEPPLWAGLIASHLDTDILDAEALDLSIVQTEAEIRRRQPDRIIMVVMGNSPATSSTPKMVVANKLARRLEGDFDIRFTGIHPIAAGCDYPVIARPFEGLPMMPWQQLPMERYRDHWHFCMDGSPRSPYASIYTSLGCPYSCYYCPVHVLYGDRRVRFRELGDILRELDTLTKVYHVRNIKFWDELFALDEERVLAICEAISYYWHDSLNIWAYGRLDCITEKMLRAMRRAGVRWVAYGFESVTDRKFVSEVEQAIEMTRRADINIMANFIFGLPKDTTETMRQSLDFAKSHLFEFVNFYAAKPYPGSRWYAETKLGTSWENYDQYGPDRLIFRDFAFQAYFTNPAYVHRIKERFGWQAVAGLDRLLAERPRTQVKV